MKKKIVIFLILLFFSNVFMFSLKIYNDPDKIKYLKKSYRIDYDKGYEITIGGSLFIYPGIVHIINGLSFHAVKMGISIPFTVNFFPVKYFSVGFNFSIGYENLFKFFTEELYNGQYMYMLLAFDVVGNIKIINKVGEINSNHRLLLEYGLSLTGRFSLKDYLGVRLPFLGFDEHLLLGPNVLIGYEFKKNRFSFVIGNFFKMQFSSNINYYTYRLVTRVNVSESGTGSTSKSIEVYKYHVNNIFDLNIGIEFRFGFIHTGPFKE